MSEQTTKKSTKSNTGKWDATQRLGFWFLITAITMFWSGMYLGGVSANNTVNDREAAKVQAVEDYKAELSKENQ